MENSNESIDYNKIVVEFINSNLNDFTNLGKEIFNGTKYSIQVKLKTGYSNYLKNVIERYGKSKSFFIRDEPQELSTFYVPVGLKSSKLSLKTANLRALLSHNSKIIISGTAGSGKSVLLKYLLINALKEKKQVPVFIELRDNNLNNIALYESIKSTFECFGLDLEIEFINKAFLSGQFLLLLDGLDEVNSERKEIIVKEIDNLIKEYPKTSIIITTRPDNLTSELQSFSIFHTLPLSLDQSIALVEKLPADENIKNKFILDLKDSLFKTHSSFLSNPLLLTIMLLTYGYSTDIPNRLSVFYNQAFEALFQRHDTMKGAYKRVRDTKLDIQDFGKILGVFCIQSYDDRKIQFSRQDAIDYLDKSKEIVNIKFNSEAFLNDLLQSVCILIEDGLFITFSHRSFQEYFTAKFIVSSNALVKKRLLEKYQSEISDDNIYKLVHELDCDFLEYEIIFPFLVNLFEEIGLKKNVGITHYLKFTKIMWTKFSFTNGLLMGTVNRSINTYNIVNYIMNNLANKSDLKSNFTGQRTDWINKKIEDSKDSNKEITFMTKNMKYNDQIILELYNCENYFSRKYLELLIKIKDELEFKRQNKANKLEEFLFNKN